MCQAPSEKLLPCLSHPLILVKQVARCLTWSGVTVCLCMPTLQVLKATDAATQAAALQLLNAACDTDTALEQLTDQALGCILDLACSSDAAVSLAALELAYSASICSAVRARLCAQVLKPVQQQQQVQQQPLKGAKSDHQQCSSRLAAVWEVGCRAGARQADTQRVSAPYILSENMASQHQPC